MRAFKRLLKRLLRLLGYEVRRHVPTPAPATATRPVGNLDSFLEDLRARGFAPRGMVDVGANRGEWTQWAWAVYPGVPSLMIEPQAEFRESLERIAESVPGSRAIIAGAGASAGELVLEVYDDKYAASFLPPADAALLANGGQRRVPIVTLDATLAEMPGFQPDLVKLDVEGFELEVLAGWQSIFGQAEIFIIETALYIYKPNQPISRDIIAYMAAHGYELYDITSTLRRPLDGSLGVVDFAFARRDGRLRSNARWRSAP